MVPISFCGQDTLLGGHFWAMGRFNLLGGQSNLLFRQMPTQPSLLFTSLILNYVISTNCNKNEQFELLNP